MCAIGKSDEKALAGSSRSNRPPAKVANSRVGAKREREKKVISLMISLYCHKKHGNFWKSYRGNSSLCAECAELDRYVRQQTDRCPVIATKTFCSNCRVHCYTPEMRERIKTVMRFSGPRMLFYHPIKAIRHVIESKREKSDLPKGW